MGRKVNHFVDNTVALSALVHGYSGKPDLAKMVNAFYLQAAGLRTSVYFDYVPRMDITFIVSCRISATSSCRLLSLIGAINASNSASACCFLSLNWPCRAM